MSRVVSAAVLRGQRVVSARRVVFGHGFVAACQVVIGA